MEERKVKEFINQLASLNKGDGVIINGTERGVVGSGAMGPDGYAIVFTAGETYIGKLTDTIKVLKILKGVSGEQRKTD